MDVKKVFFNAVSKVRQFKAGVTAALVAGVMSVPFLASAQTNDVTLSVPEINYGSVATQLMTALVPVVLAAIGIGLSIWIITLLYRMFRTLGR